MRCSPAVMDSLGVGGAWPCASGQLYHSHSLATPSASRMSRATNTLPVAKAAIWKNSRLEISPRR